MNAMYVNPYGSVFVFIPSSPTQDQMVSVILIASQVRHSSALDEYSYLDALGFLMVNSGQTLGINPPLLGRKRASVK
jgi:hypothetical protein